MTLLPAIASSCSNIADLFTKPLPTHHRYHHFAIGDTTPTVDPLATVVAPTVVASTTGVDSITSATGPTTSDLVPTVDPVPTPLFVDTGASFPIASASVSDYLTVHTSALVTSKVASKVAFTSFDPYTLITGEDLSVDTFDLPFPDSDSVDAVDFSSSLTKVSFDI